MIPTIPLSEFHERLREQGVAAIEDVALVCPVCRTPQSLRSFLAAGVERKTGERLLGFSCVSTALKAPCAYSLASDPSLAQLAVRLPDGTRQATFTPATRQQAQDLAAGGGLLRTWSPMQ
jgi:hypothetical protein